MFKKLSGRASPLSKPPAPSNSGVKPKSQPLLFCSAALPNLTAAKTTPEAQSLQGELLPPQIVVSILNGFATSLLVDKDRFDLLKSKCLEGTKLGHDDDDHAATGSLLKSSHTVLTYLTWGIRHIEKASSSLQQGEKESNEKHLKNAEQMLKSLIDSIQLELDDHVTNILSSVRVPNASFILGLAHVFLALVCKLRTHTSNLIAYHLLEAFMVSPNHARQSFIPELWNQLFRHHLSAVEAWYKKEYTNIVLSYSRSSPVSADSKPCSPKSVHNLASPVTTNSVVSRANSLMDLVSGMRLGRRGNMMNIEHDQTRALEKMNMQVKLLSDLYEQSLDEGTIQYARRYQDLIVSYYKRSSYDQDLGTVKLLQNANNNVHEQHMMAGYPVDKNAITTIIKEASSPDTVDYDADEGKLMCGRGWMGGNAFQLRRSLLDSIFGTAPINKTSKQERSYSASPSSPISSSLRLCNKELPDPLRPKEEADACSPAASYERSVKSSYAAGKATTIRDVVNAAFSPTPQEPDSYKCPGVRTTAVRGHSLSAEAFNENYLPPSDPESNSSGIGNVPTRLPPTSCKKNHLQTRFKQVNAVTSDANSKRLIDFIKDNGYQSSTDKYPTISTVENQLTKSCQTKMAAIDINMEGTKVEGNRLMKRSNSESSKMNHTSRGVAPADQELKAKVKSSRRVGGQRVTTLAKISAGKQDVVDNGKTEEVQVKYCTSLQVRQTRSMSTNSYKSQFMESTIIDNASQATSTLDEGVWGAGTSAGKAMSKQLEELANKLRAVVRAAQSSKNVLEGVGRCEEVLLELSQAWLECKSSTLLQQKGVAGIRADSVAGSCDVLQILNGLTHELLFILANSELHEAQRLALCLLSASGGTRKSDKNEFAPVIQQNYNAEKGGEGNKSAINQLPSDLNVLHALSHLLQQQGRLPEAALLLQLLHPTQYSASCHHFLPHLLPLLLDLAQRNALPRTQNAIDHIPSSCRSPFDGRLHFSGESLKPRALALMMMSRLLAAVDTSTRLQACKHVLFPNVNALPCLLHSLDCAPSVDERIAAAFILTTCMQADEICRHHIVNHVKLPSVVALLQQSSSNGSAFQTAVNFVTELLRTRKTNISEMLSCIHQDGLLNCMHALMAYLQTASPENQPPAAGLLLQLDLLLGDEHRCSVFREEALEALLTPFLKECSREATFNAARILSTIGHSQSEQELEAWLLKKAGLGATLQEKKLNTGNQCYTSSIANRIVPALKGQEQEEEEDGTMVAEWDKRVAWAIIGQGGGGLVSNALAKGMQSSIAEVRKSCLLVATWLTSHLSGMRPFDPDRRDESRHQYRASAKERMREALQAQLQEIAAVGSGNAIVDRVFAALALQNLAK